MRKMLSWVLILVGAVVLLYPTLENQYYQYQQKQLLSSWEDSLLAVDSIETDTDITLEFETDEENISDLSDLSSIDVNASTYAPISSEMGVIRETNRAEELERLAAEEEAREKAEYIQNNMEGVLIIDKINLRQPIIKGASAENMLLSVTSFENTGTPGKIGNYAIVGHRNLTYGRNFNRLGEVEVGDEINVVTDQNNYTYVISEIFRVLPDDVGVLFGTDLEKRITLITCDPIGDPTHRLIVRGNIIE